MTENTSTEKNLTTQGLLIYLGLTFVVTYLLEICAIRPLVGKTDLMSQAMAQLLTSMAMFIPAISVLVTRLVTREGFANSFLLPKNGKKSIPYFLMGWFGPAILTALGAVLYFLIFPDKFDPGMGYLAALMEAQGLEANATLLNTTAISQVVAGVLLSPLLNFLPCFGEEWGWRGYLLPKLLEKYKLMPTLLLSGLIWGLWHLPLIILGHNYGTDYPGYPYLGIFAMCIFCIVMGICFSYITIRTGSCLPAVLAHGSINGFAAVGMLFTDGSTFQPFIGPTPTGIIGGAAFIVCAVIMAVLLEKNHKIPERTK